MSACILPLRRIESRALDCSVTTILLKILLMSGRTMAERRSGGSGVRRTSNN